MTKTNKRIPRKKGQPVGSKKHSDLYTDENPKGTIRGLKFATVADAKKSVSKIKNSGKTHAHKTHPLLMDFNASERCAMSTQVVSIEFLYEM